MAQIGHDVVDLAPFSTVWLLFAVCIVSPAMKDTIQVGFNYSNAIMMYVTSKSCSKGLFVGRLIVGNFEAFRSTRARLMKKCMSTQLPPTLL